ncbi:MAG: ABC transporter permease [Candidatus Saganbacteria bacterium]|nr:ABC transporter permease [Candidatus Saganbacteria bacterium]
MKSSSINPRRLFAVMKKEFITLFRDPMSLAVMLAMPIFMIVLYGYAATLDVNHIPISILDKDKTVESRNFIDRFVSNKYFENVSYIYSDQQIPVILDKGEAKVILNIPHKFGQAIRGGKTATVQALVDGSDSTWAQSAVGYVQSIGAQFNADLIRLKLNQMGVVQPVRSPVNIIPRIWYNEDLRSMDFFIPGLIAVVLMQVSALLTSLTMISEKEQGTIESIIVSPIRKYELILGKILPYVIIIFVDMFLITACGYFLFNVAVKGSYLLLLFCAFIFLIGTMALGLFISATATSSQAAMQMAAAITLLPAMLLSGFSFPIENMPFALQIVSLFVPARYFIDILRAIYLKGVGLTCFWDNFILMTLLSVFFVVLSIVKFKKRLD